MVYHNNVMLSFTISSVIKIYNPVLILVISQLTWLKPYRHIYVCILTMDDHSKIMTADDITMFKLWFNIIVRIYNFIPVTPALWPLSNNMTVAGGGITWQMDIVPSLEQQAKRELSLLANLTAVTKTKC